MKLLTVINAAFPNMKISEATVSVWYELLGDLDFRVAQTAVKKILLESPYPPTIADIRKSAVDVSVPRKLSGAEAWGKVINAIHGYGSYGQEKALAALDATTAKVVRYMGWRELCTSEEPGVIRGQFLKMYQQVQKREEEDELLPAALKDDIAQICGNHDLRLIEGGKNDG